MTAGFQGLAIELGKDTQKILNNQAQILDKLEQINQSPTTKSDNVVNLVLGENDENSVIHLSDSLIAVYNPTLQHVTVNNQPINKTTGAFQPYYVDWENNTRIRDNTVYYAHGARVFTNCTIFAKSKVIEIPDDLKDQAQYNIFNIWNVITPLYMDSIQVLPIAENGIYSNIAVANPNRIVEIKNTEYIKIWACDNAQLHQYTSLRKLNLSGLKTVGNNINYYIHKQLFNCLALDCSSLEYMYYNLFGGLRICHTLRLDSLKAFKTDRHYFLRELDVYHISQGRDLKHPHLDIYLPKLESVMSTTLTGCSKLQAETIRIITDENNEHVKTWGLSKNQDGSWITILSMDKTKRFDQDSLSWVGV